MGVVVLNFYEREIFPLCPLLSIRGGHIVRVHIADYKFRLYIEELFKMGCLALVVF